LRIRAVGAIAVAIIIVVVVVVVDIIVAAAAVVVVVVVVAAFIANISIADSVGLVAVHLAERLHHSDPTLAFLADLQGATLQQSQGTRFLRDPFSITLIVSFITNKNNHTRENASSQIYANVCRY